MIAVIADDFTGAAEVGGLGIRFQMKVEIATRVSPVCSADLLIVVTDTRSKSSEEAIAEISLITSQLMKLNPTLIYKKVDSVLRGHIIAELLAQMKELGNRRALVIPANPHLGRIIKDGIYYLKNEKLHETGFKYDPEFVRGSSEDMISSNVIEILKQNYNGDGEAIKLIMAKVDTPLPEEGIMIGEALVAEDLRKWSRKLEGHTLIAGASSFFLALLEDLNYSRREPLVQKQISFQNRKMLLVCGSSFSKSKKLVANALANGAPVSLMPLSLIHASASLILSLQDKWVSEIMSLFVDHDCVIVAADPEANYTGKYLGKCISKNTAMVVARVMEQISIEELMLEGGATASSILNEMRLEKLYPEQELADGVIRTRIGENKLLHITFKPGSYRWPDPIWNFQL